MNFQWLLLSLFLLILFSTLIAQKVENRNAKIYFENAGEFNIIYTRNISKQEQISWEFKSRNDFRPAMVPIVHTEVQVNADSSETPVLFEIRHVQSHSWTLPLVVGGNSWNQNTLTSISPSSPIYFKLGPFPSLDTPYARLDVALVKTSAQEDPACFTVSIQKPICPVEDHQNNVQYDGISHTMSTTTTMSIHRDDLKEERFLVFVMHDDYSYCNSSEEQYKNQLLQISNKNYDNSTDKTSIRQLEFVLRESINVYIYITATVGVAMFFLVTCVVFSVLFFKFLKNVRVEGAGKIIEGRRSSSSEEDKRNLCFGLFYVKGHESRKNVSLRDECDKTQKQISKRAHSYLGTICVVSLFYALPVVQFMLLYQRVLNKTGNEDLCYFNFKCLHSVGNVTAFNHLFSNIGYVMLGILFLLIVRTVSHSRGDTNDDSRGLFDHYGIYYAMGSALVMEGLMSSIYHICPTHLNYQFDTSFMYITAMLCLVKVYQSRHPDSNASAVLAFLAVALIILLGAITAIYQVWWLWMIITFLHVTASFLFSVHLYSWGDWKLTKNGSNCNETAKLKNIWQSFMFPFIPLTEPIIWMLVTLNVLNWAVAIVGHLIFFESQDIASYLLMLLLLNMGVYLTIYVTLKLCVVKEKIPWPSWMYFGLSLPFWVAGLVLFFKVTAAWERSQAESRELNEECVFLSFYDYHDIWHFLSALGMFFMFMFLFTMDDGILKSKREDITIF